MPSPVFVKSADLTFPANCDAPIAASLRFRTVHAEDGLAAEFDWRQTGPQTWEIEIETAVGNRLRLQNGGAGLEVNGVLDVEHTPHEYEDIYDRFAELLRDGRSLVDAAPLRLVADAFMVDYIVIGGGNAKLIEDLPPGVRLGNNLTAFRGGMRLWALESIHTHAAGVADAPLPEAQPREWCVI